MHLLPQLRLPHLILIGCAIAAAATAQTAVLDAGKAPNARRGMIDRYCASCHNDRLRTGGFTLEHADPTHVLDAAPQWEKVVRKLRAGAMPPAGLPRPDRAAMDEFAGYLETELDRAPQDPGRSVLRRLNRAEYAASIKDLLALEIDVSNLLPADDANFGFDNIADSLRISPALLESYLSASRKISRLAIGSPSTPVAFAMYGARADLGQDQHMEGLPLGTRGGLLAKHYFPLDGEYVFKPKMAVNTSAKIRGLDFEHRFVILIDGKKVHEARFGGEEDEDAAAISPPDSEADILSRLETRVRVSAGPHEVAATFLEKTAALPDGLLQPFSRTNFDTQEQRGVPFVASLSIGGPYQASGPGDTPSRHRILTCKPTTEAQEIPCAKKILSALMRRAYRKPVSDADLEAALSLYQAGRNAATDPKANRFEAGIENALRFVLSSPEFLFRLEGDPATSKPGTAHRISDLELASRLSFFLWSSIPDEELLSVAERGKLQDPATLDRQVRRMLADPRAEALVTNFAGQWLYLRNLPGVSRDLETFPNFDDNLRQAYRTETELFVQSVIREDRSVLDFLRADYTFVNERLARQYGIPNVQGSYFRRVTLPDVQRRGLLGQGSILTVTSYATRTSPVLRGKWLLENILGVPAPPPPPNVPPLAENKNGAAPRTVRERMEEHRRSPACGVCHNIMDPLGFSLENFDAIGTWRERDARVAIDASGTLVDGSKVNGPVTLREALLSRPDAFAQTLTEKLAIYALGRGLEYTDMPEIRKIVRASARNNYRFSTLILGVVQSAPFQMKRSAEPLTQRAETKNAEFRSISR
jgi:mono/diheme cytochrome c family protein